MCGRPSVNIASNLWTLYQSNNNSHQLQSNTTISHNYDPLCLTELSLQVKCTLCVSDPDDVRIAFRQNLWSATRTDAQLSVMQLLIGFCDDKMLYGITGKASMKVCCESVVGACFNPFTPKFKKYILTTF